MIKKGVYAATLSVLDDNCSLNIDETITHAENIIKEGLHGVFFLFWDARFPKRIVITCVNIVVHVGQY